jgi:hypothetical protein
LAGLFGRIFGGKSRTLALARNAELRGDLRRAAALFEDAGRLDEAARVRRARALAVLGASVGVTVTASRRIELGEAAAELESLGDFARAADAYAAARDREGQARALARAGEVEGLEQLLEGEQARERDVRARRAAHEEIDALIATGQRREALERALSATDPTARARGVALQATRATGPVVRLSLRGHGLTLVLGDRVIVGRALGRTPDGATQGAFADADEPSAGFIAVGAVAVSRRHLALERRGEGVWVRDLGSHNGTRMGTSSLRGEASVGQGIALHLGGEVPCVVRPASDLVGAVAIEIAGHRYLAPLGPAHLGIGAWRLEVRSPWVDLVTDDAPPAFSSGLRLAERVPLLGGDAFGTSPDGEALVRIEAP